MPDQHNQVINPSVVGRQPLEQALPPGPTPAAQPPQQPSQHVPVQPIIQQGVLNTAPVAAAPVPSAQSYLNQNAARFSPGGKRYVLQLSGDMAMLLVVVWVASMAVMFVLGQYWRSAGGAGLASGPAGNREISAAPTAKRQGDTILLLQSAPNATVESVSFFEERARNLNEFVRKSADKGWKPYFGVRKPINGGVELAFGYVDGVWGINQSEFIEFAKLLSQPTNKGGAGYGQARWVKVEE